ncbi:MAG: electron transfer flavoprotein subunit beta/FixA family protein [Bacteroidota bacterium]
MRFAVCVNQVLDVTAPAQIRGGALVLPEDRRVLDHYAACALEAALTLRETHGDDTWSVEAVLIGPEEAGSALRKALAMGADSGTHLVTDTPLDDASTAALLADQFHEDPPDAIWLGKQSQDTDAGLVGGRLAERLGAAFVANAVGAMVEEEALVIDRQGDRGIEVVEMPAPCVVTVSNNMNDPRTPNLRSIMAAKRKAVETREVAPDLPLAVAISASAPPARPPGRTLEGPPEAAAREVVRLLSDDLRLI